MSEHVTVRQLKHATQQAQEWLNDLASRPPFETREQAYSLLRAVLHAVRDRLTPEEVAHLGSQLPMMVRGFYFEGWRPALAPNDFHTEDEFLEHVQSCLGPAPAMATNLRAAALATLAFLSERVDEGEMRHVTHQLPPEIAALFPDRVPA